MSNDEMMQALLEYLASGKPIEEGSDEEWTVGFVGELSTARLAKTWAARMLRAAKADGLGGCPLCCN